MNLNLSRFRKKALSKAMFAWLTIFVSLATWLGSAQDAAAQAPWKGSELFVYHMRGKPLYNNKTPACFKFVSFKAPKLNCPPPPIPDPPSGGGQTDQGGGYAFMDEDFVDEDFMAPPPGGVYDAFDNAIMGLSFYRTNKSCTWSGKTASLTVCPIAGSNTIINGFYFEYGVSMTGGGAAKISKPTLRVLVGGVVVHTQSFESSDRYNGFYTPFPESFNTTAWEGKNITFEVSDVREHIIDDFAVIGTNNCSANRVCLGNLVWEDTNNDGIKDAAESVKAGVKVQVFRDDADGIFEIPTRDYLFEDGRDGLIAETTTDANGNYNVCLPVGNYFVRIPPTNFDSGKPLYQCSPTQGPSVTGDSDLDNRDHTIASSKSDYKVNGMISTLVTLTVGGEPTNDGNDANTNSTIDFGVNCNPAVLMNLGNLIWIDTNKDGLKGASELGIDGVTVELYVDGNANGAYDVTDVFASRTTTSGGGIYNFGGLVPGNYIVLLPESNYQPAVGALVGYVPSPGKDPATDPDDDLDNDDNGIASGNYKIVTKAVTLAVGTEPTADSDGNNGNLTVDIAVYKEESSGACSEYGFPYRTGADETLDGMQLYDANGVFQRFFPIAPSRSGGQIWYNEAENKIYATSTNIAGGVNNIIKRWNALETFPASTSSNFFQMMESPELDIYGKYYAREKASLFRIYPDALPAFTAETDVVTGGLTGADVTYNDGSSAYTIYSNKVFDSKNNLYLKATTTGIVRYAYDVATSKWLGTSPITAGSNVTVNRKSMMYDPKSKKIFFYGSDNHVYSLPEEFAASTNATLESDSFVAAGNTIIQSEFDPRSRKIITISSTGTLVPTRIVIMHDVSNAGVVTYRTSFAVSENRWTASDIMEHILVVPCGGLVNPPGGIELKLGNVIWHDVDNNGIKDATEVGIANVGILLYKDVDGNGIFNRLTDTRWDSTTTDASGYYLFDKLPEGDYFALIPNSNFFTGTGALNGMYSSTPTIADPNTNIDNDDNGINPVMPRSHINDGVESGKITLSNVSEPTADGDDANGNMTLDFGFHTPTIDDAILRLGNRVWEDANNNIRMDPGETYFDGVKLTLLKDNGDLLFDPTEDVVVANTTTAGNGFYLFDKLLPGNYYVRVDKENFNAGQVLDKYRNSSGYYGANTCFDSTDHGNEVAFIYAVDGIVTSYISMELNEEPPANVDGDDKNGNMVMDFGFFRPVRLGNRVWKDTNKNGKRDAGEPDINEVTLNVYKDNGDGILNISDDTYVGMRTTQDSGYYSFNDLISGSYFVEIPASDFVPGGVLENLVSSPSVVGENPAANNQDHGIDNATPASGGVVSQIVVLAYGTEPAATVDTDDTDGNFTIDFGLIDASANFDLALKKTLATGQSSTVSTGGTAKFTISITNQGTVDATNVQVTDYIPTGLTLNDANWILAGSKATLATPIASLVAGATVTRDITFTVGTTTGVITNFAEISAATGGTDIDSTPDADNTNDGTPKNDVVNENGKTGGDEDDHDPEPITVSAAPVFDLALKKTLATGQSSTVSTGGTAKFTISITNQGTVDATNVQVTDYIPTGLTLNDANWILAGSKATLATPIASLVAGATVTRDITFTVGTTTGVITNFAEISAATGGTDIDSTPDADNTNDGTPKNDVINEDRKTTPANDEDDHDPEPITVTASCVTPTFKSIVIPATCSGTTANSDAKISLTNIVNGDKAAYSLGGTYTGGAYSAATAVSGGAVMFSGITNLAGNNVYTVRVFSGSDACFQDRTMIIPVSDCNTLCTVDAGNDMMICNPTATVNLKDAAATEEWIAGTGNPAAATINASTGVVSGMTADGIYSFILRDKVNTSCSDMVYVFRSMTTLPTLSSCETTYQLPTDAGVTWTVAAGNTASVTASGLITGMTTNGTYTFNVTFGACSATVDVEKVTCACITPNAGADFAICLPKTGANLTDAPSGHEWVIGSGNPAAASINATTGVISGMTTVGVYKFKLQKTGEATCFDEIQITVSSGNAPIVLCNDGSTSYTLVAQSGLVNVVWYNMAGVQVGTGTSLIVKSTTLGLEDGTEAFYFIGQNGTATGCDVELCCPVKFLTQSCCPVPNCVGITVIKN